MKNILYRCKKCLFPSTKPDLHFDKEGVCLACRFREHELTIDWDKREQEFVELVEKHKSKDGNNYDCMIAVSGGKDSTYQAHICHKYGLKPLLVSFEPSWPTEVGKQNLQNMVDAYNCDLIQMRKSPTYKKLARIGFDVVGDHEWPNHVGIYCWPMRMAVNHQIPLIIYGETRGTIGLGRWDDIVAECEIPRSTVEQYVGMNGYRLTDIMEYDSSITKQDVLPYLYPENEELDKLGIKAYSIGYFFYWDRYYNMREVRKHGWKQLEVPNDGTFAPWEDIDCGFMPMHQYFKFIKYGYARATDHASYEIRMGRMTKKQAKELIFEYDWKLPRTHFEDFLGWLEIDEQYFFDTVDRFANPLLFERDSKGRFKRMYDDNLVRTKLWYDSFEGIV